MSRHLFDTHYQNRPVQVVLGWDRPLQYVFLTIEWRDQPDQYLYPNLDAPHVCHDLGYDIDRLGAVGIRVPASMIQEVIADRINHAGNRQVVHFTDTPLRE